ncbi:hypothetical protein SS50377_27901 [Spironucleus salmonicida]|uniref:Uncharacterized protein n=1 Tax=Spironucleus salmonicida TaxID=348837 RepID=V6LD81_9EUKA|nr:hypothetical protein SS50377_27901 [Spironucleus salmonicida]|eukprot:EST42460.1 Hypothetical protein SS50377_17766 [Spironucleus salmonicida]
MRPIKSLLMKKGKFTKLMNKSYGMRSFLRVGQCYNASESFELHLIDTKEVMTLLTLDIPVEELIRI